MTYSGQFIANTNRRASIKPHSAKPCRAIVQSRRVTFDPVCPRKVSYHA
jgi:hypothetical protein